MIIAINMLNFNSIYIIMSCYIAHLINGKVHLFHLYPTSNNITGQMLQH